MRDGGLLDDLGIVNSLQPVSFVYNQGDNHTRYDFIAEDTAAPTTLNLLEDPPAEEPAPAEPAPLPKTPPARLNGALRAPLPFQSQ